MPGHRSLLLRALLLDGLGQLMLLGLLVVLPEITGLPTVELGLNGQLGWLLFVVLAYPALGWLFGSFTVLRWRKLPWLVLLQRLVLTAVATLMLVAISRWLINPAVDVWLVHRRVQLVWISGVTAWALLVRVGLRRGVFSQESPRLLLLAQPDEVDPIMRAWKRVPGRQNLRLIQPHALLERLQHSQHPLLLVAITPALRQTPEVGPLMQRLESRDPRQIRVLSLIRLFEQEQERFPPALLPDDVLAYDDLPWASTFSVQAQLKRLADVMLSAVLLLITAPIVVLAALLIWLDDQGPIFYTQQRSGWLGQPFKVVKLRTMTVQPSDAPATWTTVGDQRITSVGVWLRRFRVDELPQLFNVFKGEMSLIGPRPERPELEHNLELQIPHYRKRHWMRPGLSGWAQVCAPYASNVEDSDLKLSYDLYYLRHFSCWLDLVILFRTIKTVLKAQGR
tara:strand:+ start:144 stop:1496 length:1353 start_codon:yes stop_codon:yes gene_type:complete